MNRIFPSKNPELLKSKLEKFTPNTTRIVTDFDSTITIDNGKTSWGLFADSGLMPEEYVRRRAELKNTYYPYEINTSLSVELRNEYMRKWWQEHLHLFQKFSLRRDILEQVVIREMKLRDGFHEFLSGVKTLSVPVLILSAGITQSIEAVLGSEGILYQNISIVSNSLVFDTAGICIGTGEDIIHVANKDEWDATEEVKKTFTGRQNILLFGDSLDDIKMIESDKRESTVAVGFCTSSRSHQRDQFFDTFDIVVESNDSDLGICGELLKIISSQG